MECTNQMEWKKRPKRVHSHYWLISHKTKFQLIQWRVYKNSQRGRHTIALRQKPSRKSRPIKRLNRRMYLQMQRDLIAKRPQRPTVGSTTRSEPRLWRPELQMGPKKSQSKMPTGVQREGLQAIAQ